MDIRRYHNFLGLESGAELWAGVQSLPYVPWRTGSCPHLHAELPNQALPNAGLLGLFVQRVQALDRSFSPVRCYINLHSGPEHSGLGCHQDDLDWTWIYYLPTGWRADWGGGTEFYQDQALVLRQPWQADLLIGFHAQHWHGMEPITDRAQGTRAVIVTKCRRCL